VSSRHSQLVAASKTYLESLRYLVSPVKAMGTPVRGSDGEQLRRNGKPVWSRGQQQPGTADLLACSPHGRFVAVEIKVGRDKLRPDQAHYRARVERNGGLFVEVRDNVDVLIALHAEGTI